MPVNHPCTICRKACKKNVREGDESIHCDQCKKWVHLRCTELSPEELNHVTSTDEEEKKETAVGFHQPLMKITIRSLKILLELMLFGQPIIYN